MSIKARATRTYRSDPPTSSLPRLGDECTRALLSHTSHIFLFVCMQSDRTMGFRLAWRSYYQASLKSSKAYQVSRDRTSWSKSIPSYICQQGRSPLTLASCACLPVFQILYNIQHDNGCCGFGQPDVCQVSAPPSARVLNPQSITEAIHP